MKTVPTAALARDGISEQVYHRRWWTHVILTLSLVMVVMGNSSLNVTIPTLVRELGASDTELQWMIDAYALVFGGLLLTMGALGDRFGRKGALQVGLGLFGAGTLAVALFATESWHIIAGRIVMGIGAALVMPATLSILTTVFPREERGKAIGLWAAFAGLGGMVGLLSSGWLLEHFSWGSVFWINVPIVAIALGAGVWLVPTSRDPHQVPLDIVGSLLSIFGLGGLLFGIIEGPEEGWTSPLILGTLAASVVVLALFVLWERRSTHPMLPMAFFRSRGFNGGVIAISLVFFGMFGTFFVLTQYMQFVLDFSPFAAGIRFLPLGAGMILGAPNSDRLVRRFGAARVVTVGMVMVAVGMTGFAFLQVDSSYLHLAVALAVTGLGMGLSMAPATTVIMSSIPARKAGVGSSMNDTAREVGGAFGIAVLGTILKDIYVRDLADKLPDSMPAAARDMAESGLGGALAVAGRMGPAGATIAQVARDAYVDALLPTFLTAAGIALVAAVIVYFFFPRPGHGLLLLEHDEAPAAKPMPAASEAKKGDMDWLWP